MKLTKTLLSLVLIGLLALAIRTPASAQELASGTCGRHVTWVLSWNEEERTAVLTISGTGDIERPESMPLGITGKVVIEDGVTGICGGAFANSEIKSVTISNTVTQIGASAFAGCSKLTSVVIPDSVTVIGENAFKECKGLTDVVVGSGVTHIGKGAFIRCSSLTSITLPNVAKLEDSAFFGCTSLKSANLLNSPLEQLYYRTFGDCSSLTSIQLPEGLVRIGRYAFDGCSKLASIYIPDGVRWIEEHAFRGCGKLASIDFPEHLEAIGENAFNGCSSLVSVVIPEGITIIEFGTFVGCTKLSSVIIPASVSRIDSVAFSQNLQGESLWHVFYKGTEEQWSKIKISSEIFDSIGTLHFNCTGQEIADPVNKICSVCVANCTHDWYTSEVTKEATCMEAGEQTYTCYDCNTTKTEAIPQKEHTPGEEATCMEGQHCKVCNTELAPAKAHTEVIDASIEATCTEPGLSEGKHCAVCNSVLVEQIEIPALGHKYTTEKVEPTCVKAGSVTYTCHCGDTYKEDIPSIAHSYVDGSCEYCGSPKLKLGDVNGDGKINVTDAMVVLRYAVKKITANDLNVEAADVNSDGKVNVTDAMQILRYAVKKITEFKPAK